MTAGGGPRIGERVSLLHEASGSVLHGKVELCPTIGLVVDVDGRIFDMDREGWHVDRAETEPPVGSVVVDEDDDAWQRRPEGWVMATSGGSAFYTWDHLRAFVAVEVIWEPKP